MKTLDKTTMTRLAWLTELRRQGHRQCFEEYAIGANVCALGLLVEVSGCDPKEPSTWNFDWRDETQVGALAGLTAAQSTEATRRNDGDHGYHRHTFAEIADVVSSWFPS